MKEFVTVGYTYSELSEAAREKVKQWYLDDESRSEFFYENVMCYLAADFPCSELDVCYSLSYCQGDGLNIYGKLNLYEFLEIWQGTPEEKKQMQMYLEKSGVSVFEFDKNHRYCYSCKFLDKKRIANCVYEIAEELIDNGFSENEIDKKLIEFFYIDMLEYFENLDEQYEKVGYEYLYECDDSEIQECCEINDWYFTADGDFIG